MNVSSVSVVGVEAVLVDNDRAIFLISKTQTNQKSLLELASNAPLIQINDPGTIGYKRA
jgi:hypothetical protein